MEIQKETLTAAAPKNVPHDRTNDEFAKVLMHLDWKKDNLVRDDGSVVDAMSMTCMVCGKTHLLHKKTDTRWMPRYYACDNGCNSYLWPPESNRVQEWAVVIMGTIMKILYPNMTPEESRWFVSNFADLADTVRDPHDYNRLWAENLWGVEDAIYTHEKRVGKTPYVIAAYNLLAHLAEYNPWDHVEENTAAILGKGLRGLESDIKVEIHKHNNPHLRRAKHIDHEAVLAKTPSFSDVTPDSLKSSIMNALSTPRQ